ncbi:hypothetical protein MKX83_23655 [Cytobacillus sp. FSL M8-0252]|uniref:hypothetical protein n=1 Tax=Cytobacillus sp. FSL M8-0252 TaxID=2921621 RepID=UPI0030F4E479
MVDYFELHLSSECYFGGELQINTGLNCEKRILYLIADLNILESFLLNLNRKDVYRILFHSIDTVDIKDFQEFKEVCKKYKLEHGLIVLRQ